MRYDLGAKKDIGNERRHQEDHMDFRQFGGDILAVIADGSGTSDDRLQPAVLAVNSVINEISDIANDRIFKEDILFFLNRAMINANNILGTLKLADEERYNGYAASMTILYLEENGNIYYAHAGNTRLYILREGKLMIMTEDHTVAMEKLFEGLINMDQYYYTDDRLRMTSGVGLSAEPNIYLNKGTIKVNDLILMTTDGVHYALTEDNIVDVVLHSESIMDAAEKLVFAAKTYTNYPDNMAAVVIGARN